MATKDLVVQLRAKVDQFQKDLAIASKSLAGIEKQTLQLNKVFAQFRGVALAAIGGFGAAAAVEFVKLGAAAKQTEDAFNALTSRAGQSGTAIVNAMRKATADTVDESDLMQKAIKGIALGLTGEEMTKMAEMARQTARITGESVGATFEKLADAISTNMPRALKQMGLVTKEQMQVMEKALSAGVENVSLLEMAYANYRDQLARLGPLHETEAEKIQQLNARWTDLKETIGQTMIGVLVALSDPIRHITESLKEQEDQLEENIDDMSRLAAAARNMGITPDGGVPVWRGKIGKAPQEVTEAQRYRRYILSDADIYTRQLKDQTAALEAKKKAEKDTEDAAKKALDARRKDIELIEKIGAAQIESAGDYEEIEAKAYVEWEKLAQKKIERQYKDAEELAKKQIKEQEKALEKMEKDWEHFWENVQDFTADTFYDLFTNIEDGWSNVLDNMKRWFLKWISEIAAKQVVISLQGVLGQQNSVLGGLLGLTSSATGGGGGGGILSGIGNLASSFVSPSNLLGGLGGLFSGGAAMAGGLTAPALGGTFAAGGMEALLGSSFAGAGTGTIGAGALAGAGSILGPIGIAAALGTLAYSLLKGKKKEPQFYSGVLGGAFGQTSYVPGQGLTMGSADIARGSGLSWNQEDWWNEAANAWVKSANDIITTFNDQISSFLKLLPTEYKTLFEQLLARQDWTLAGVGRIGQMWNSSEMEKELQQALGAATSEWQTVLAGVLGGQADQLTALIQSLELKAQLTTSWDQFVMGLKTGDLAPVQSMETFSNYYKQLMDKVRENPGDVAAANALMQYTSGTYLPFTKSYMEGEGDYATIFNSIISQSGEMYNTVFSGINDKFDELLDYVKELLDRPIEVTVNLNGTEIANAVAVAADQGTVQWNPQGGTAEWPVGWSSGY